MQLQRAVPYSLGFDTVAHVGAAAPALKTAGMSFAVRYLGNITPAELSAILTAGLAFMPVCYARTGDFSGANGSLDGGLAVHRAMALGCPPGVTVWCDLESCTTDTVTAQEYVNRWAQEVKTAGYDAGLYVGVPQPIDAYDLYHKLLVDRYWQSCSRGVPEPEACGFCMNQMFKPNTQVAGVQVDVDVIHHDFLGRLPNWLIA